MQPPHGPRPIAKNGQVVVPKEVLRAADLKAGDSVYFIAGDDPPGTVLIVPVEIATRWFEHGRRNSMDTRDQEASDS
jgi:AbrB family looped-hinge helix DNA binding protein